MTITPETVLKARRWSALGLPKTPEGLRAAQRVVHPDVCKEPNAHDAFIRVSELFNGPDIHTRLADGSFVGNHKVAWKFDPSNNDLARSAEKAHRDILKATTVPVEWVGRANLSGDTLTIDYGQAGWYYLSEYALATLSARDVGWILRRLCAIVHVASEAGWVHGDITSESIVVLPSEHGVRLDGWWAAVKKGEPLKVKPSAFTPIRFLSNAPTESKMSIAQIADTMLHAETSDNLKALLKRLKFNPVSPSEALKQIDAALLKDFGKPAWHELPVPATGEI